jgi:hypothetical protein
VSAFSELQVADWQHAFKPLSWQLLVRLTLLVGQLQQQKLLRQIRRQRQQQLAEQE